MLCELSISFLHEERYAYIYPSLCVLSVPWLRLTNAEEKEIEFLFCHNFPMITLGFETGLCKSVARLSWYL